MKRLSCSICNSKLQHIYSLNEFPIKLCCLDEPTYDKHELSFSQCEICKTIQLDKLIPLDILYSDSHNTTSVGNIWKKYFEKIIQNQKRKHIFSVFVLKILKMQILTSNSSFAYEENGELLKKIF